MDPRAVDHDKIFSIFSAANDGTEDVSAMENLIHESGRLQLNTYQAFVQNLMNPRSDLRSLMLVHMTGTGKTITALATATEYVRQYQATAELSSVSNVIVLGFTKDIFKAELMSHPEFAFVDMEEATELKELEQRMHESPEIARQYQTVRHRYNRRLRRREVNGIYQFYGYRQFANRVINMEDVAKMSKTATYQQERGDIGVDPKDLIKWIKDGDVRINTDFIKTLARSFVICDEVHNLYKGEWLNTYGLAINIVFDYFYKTLPTNDINFGSIRSVMLSATPLTSSALEIVPIVSLLSGATLSVSQLFKTVEGIDQLTSAGMATIRQSLNGRISYIMDDNPKEYPSSSFAGSKIAGIDYLHFIRSEPTGHQLKRFENWTTRDADVVDERGTNMIKDITFPSTKAYPQGVIFSRNISDLSELPESTLVRQAASGFYSSNIFKLKALKSYSCKYEKLVQMCMDMKDTKHGKIFIYHPLVQGSGTELIISILIANGFVLEGDVPVRDSICMHCQTEYGKHKSGDHDFTPVKFTFITGSLSKPVVASRLNAFNNDNNLYGEQIKIIVGSRAMRESHTLKACRHVVVAHEPSSVSELIQIIGRSVRKHVHAMLPPELRTVQIHILTTNVDKIKVAKNDPTTSEELSYRTKVLQYKQINMIERIMYDVSIDYLINFRFKLRETPPLLGDSYSLDKALHDKYKKTLSQAYADLRNGVSPVGIHTNRFNVFYFEGEVRLVIMIIKRILLNYQPIISIRQLQELIREPPFHIEYNTKLIADEAIATAIHKVSFNRNQLRLIIPASAQSTVNSLFDQSSAMIDQSGLEYKIICVGHPLCLDSYLTKRSLAAITDQDNSLIDAFRQTNSSAPPLTIDLRELAENWASTIDVDEILDEIKRNPSKEGVNTFINKLPFKTHCILCEWAVEQACAISIRKQKSKDLDIVKYVLQYYESTGNAFTISQLKYTNIYDRYKKYDVNTASGWYNAATRPSTGKLPIGHTINDIIRVYNIAEKAWLELKSIAPGTTSKHPYGFYIFQERVGQSLSLATKIKFDNDPSSKGITMVFLQRPMIESIAQKLKLKITDKHKPEIIQSIVNKAWEIQAKLYPKRVIYRIIDM